MLPQVVKPTLINKYGPMAINNIPHDPCEYLRFIYGRSIHLQDKIMIYQVIKKHCDEPIHTVKK